MATLQERRTADGQARYRALVRVKGFPPQTATFERKTDARRWAQRTEAALHEGRHFPAREAARRTLAEVLDRYLAEVVEEKPKGSWKPVGALKWWRRHLGAYSLLEVTPARIAECRDKLLREDISRGIQSSTGGAARSTRGVKRDAPRRRSPATVNRYLAALSHALTIAVREWGWIEVSPLGRVTRPKEPRGRVRFLSEDEKKSLLEACRKSSSPYLYPVVVLALSTGARQGEILGLRWPQVSLARRVIVLEETKNGERRVLPLAGAALDSMTELSKTRRRIDTDLLFARAGGGGPFNLRRFWDAAVREAKIEDFRFHDLRHTAASYLAMSGATLAEIAEILGHKTLAMVKRYAHLSEQHTSGVVARMNAQFL